MAEVTIVDEREITIRPTPEEEKKVVAITYRVETKPPRTVYVDKDKYTDEAVKEAIKLDMAKVAERKTRTIEI